MTAFELVIRDVWSATVTTEHGNASEELQVMGEMIRGNVVRGETVELFKAKTSTRQACLRFHFWE